MSKRLMTLRLRGLDRVSDLPALAAAFDEPCRSAFRFAAPEVRCGDVGSVGRYLASAGKTCVVAEVDGVIAGVRWVAPTLAAEVATTGCWMAPQWRGQGIGKRLLEEALVLARTAPQLSFVATGTLRENAAARGNLSACGFVEVAVDDPLYRRAFGPIEPEDEQAAAVYSFWVAELRR